MEDKTHALEKLKRLMMADEEVDVASLKVGDIIYLSLDESDGLILNKGYNTRNKYIVIIGFTPEGVAIGALLINSNIDISKSSEELMNCQYLLKQVDYSQFLIYDSWLDCSDIFEIPLHKMKTKKPKKKGSLKLDDLKRILEFLKETEVFDNYTKRRYGLI